MREISKMMEEYNYLSRLTFDSKFNIQKKRRDTLFRSLNSYFREKLIAIADYLKDYPEEELYEYVEKKYPGLEKIVSEDVLVLYSEEAGTGKKEIIKDVPVYGIGGIWAHVPERYEPAICNEEYDKTLYIYLFPDLGQIDIVVEGGEEDDPLKDIELDELRTSHKNYLYKKISFIDIYKYIMRETKYNIG